MLVFRFCERAFSSCGARASHYRGLSCCGAQAPDAQAQWLWLVGPVAPWHVGSSQTRARTRVPCIGRQTLNHCATREAPLLTILICISFIDNAIDHLFLCLFSICNYFPCKIPVHVFVHFFCLFFQLI